MSVCLSVSMSLFVFSFFLLHFCNPGDIDSSISRIWCDKWYHLNEDLTPLPSPSCFYSSHPPPFFLLRRVSSAIKLSLHRQTLTGCTNPRCRRSTADPFCKGRCSPGLKPMGHVSPPQVIVWSGHTIINMGNKMTCSSHLQMEAEFSGSVTDPNSDESSELWERIICQEEDWLRSTCLSPPPHSKCAH